MSVHESRIHGPADRARHPDQDGRDRVLTGQCICGTTLVLAVKRPVRSGLARERQVACHSLVGCTDGLVGVQIDFLVFDAPPKMVVLLPGD